MASQESQDEEGSLMDLLSEAAEWTEAETIKKLPKTLPLITDFLQDTPPAVEGVQVARFVFGSFLPHLKVDHKAFTLFQATFPFLKTALNELLKDIEEEEKENVEKINELIQVCMVLCECCVLGLQFLLQEATIALDNINTLPPSVIYVINKTLHHCQNSEDMYKSHVDEVKENVSLLFRQAVEAAMQLAKLLPHLTFDTYSDADMDVLLKVCKKLPITASRLSCVSEMRGCVLVWRSYSELLQRHHNSLCTKLSLTSPIQALVDEVKSSLVLLTSLSVSSDSPDKLDDKDQKVAKRAIKLASFCVKVIVGVCEKFRGYLHDTHNTLVKLLILLFRFFGNNKGQVECPKSVRSDVGQQVTMAIEPLLQHLRDDEDFIKAVFETRLEGSESEVETDSTPYLLLLVSLPIPLPPNPATALHLNVIIKRIFHTIEKCHARLSYPLLLDGVMYGGRAQTNCTLYEYVLMRVCAAAATMDSEQFLKLEHTLVKALLSGNTWTSLLAADLWVFIARYGSSEVCLHHCEVLTEILCHLPPSSHQYLSTSTLMARLIAKLMPQHHTSLMQTISHLECGVAVKHLVAQSSSEKDPTTKLCRECVEECTQKIELILSRTATEKDVRTLAEDMEQAKTLVTAYAQKRDNSDTLLGAFTNALTNLWVRLPTEHFGSSVVDVLVYGLLNVTASVIHCFTTTQLTQVVCMVREVCQGGSAMVGVGVCGLLAALGPTTLPQTPDLPNLISLVANLLTLVLNSEDPLVYQTALDTFVAFGCHTTHEEVLVEGLGGCREEVEARVTAFLQQEPHPTTKSRHNILTTQVANISTNPSETSITGKLFKPIDLEKASKEAERVRKNVEGPSKDSERISTNSMRVNGETHPCDETVGEKSAKRQRVDSKEMDRNSPQTLNILLDTLNQSRTLMKQLKDTDIPLDKRLSIKSALKEMMCLMRSEIS